jgi:hypothetical protein
MLTALLVLVGVQAAQLAIAVWQLTHLRAPKPPAGRVK